MSITPPKLATSNWTKKAEVTLQHLVYLTDDRGIFEHAKGRRPRYSHGYCTDDNARLLVVAARDKGRTLGSSVLGRIAIRFLLDAQQADGTTHNRLGSTRTWQDDPAVEDAWGRSLWGFGTAAASSADTLLRHRGYEAFDRGCHHRAPSLRTMSYAALGAAEFLRVDEEHDGALNLLSDTADMICGSSTSEQWPWPEARLTYANALIPDALIAAGNALSRGDVLRHGLDLLQWLTDSETVDNHFSVTPTGGRGPNDVRPFFDQQPIEVATIAEASARAFQVTGEAKWLDNVIRAVNWFLGENDTGVPMIDSESGGGYDGLEPDGVNANQGAESTLSMVATMQHRANIQPTVL